jgi:rhodanese-related sulfurtransferase
MNKTLMCVVQASSAVRGMACAAVVGFGLVMGGCSISDADIEYIDLSQMRQAHAQGAKTGKSLFLIDPRTPSEYAAGHIPGARNILLPTVKSKSKPDPDIEEYGLIVVYGNDPASVSAKGMTKRLMEIGYDDVKMYRDGFAAWRLNQLPIETGREEKPELEFKASKSSR